MSKPERTLPWPVLDWLQGYRREWLPADAVAGLTTAAVVVPKALAFAAIAGLPLQVGLATAFVPPILYAVLGGSRPMSVSSTTTLAILTAAQIAVVAPEGSGVSPLAAGATLALLVGLALLVARLLRLGAVANLISDPVLSGFKAGIGLVIVVDQLPKLLGIHIPKSGFFRNVAAIVGQVPETSIPTLLVGGGLLAGIVLLEHFAPRVPAPLVAAVAGIAASGLFGLGALGVATVGAVPGGLPPVTMPILNLMGDLWPGAIGIALMSFIETVAVGRAFRGKSEPQPDANRELAALGLANVAGGLLGCMPAGGGTSQSAVSRRAGAKTQLTGLVSALGALATLLFLAPLLGLMPSAALAAVVIATSVPLINIADFRAIARIRRMEFFWAIAATMGVVVLGTLKGILVAVLVSVVALVVQSAAPQVYEVRRKRGTNVFRRCTPERADDESFPGVLLARIVGRLFFLNVKQVREDLAALVEKAQPRVVILDFSAVVDLEFTALKTLIEAEESSRERGVLLCLAALTPAVRQVVERSSLGATLGRDRMFFNLEQAVESAPALLARPGGPDSVPAPGRN